MIVRGIEMKCEICDGTFEGKGYRTEIDPKDATFERVVDYKKCNLCGAGMVLFHPYMPMYKLGQESLPLFPNY